MSLRQWLPSSELVPLVEFLAFPARHHPVGHRCGALVAGGLRATCWGGLISAICAVDIGSTALVVEDAGSRLHILVPSSALAVRGLTEVLRHLPRLVRLRRSLVQRFARDQPALFIGIDAPDFNLGLEAKLKRRGVRTIHYVSPSVWAWREERIKSIGEAADHVLALFPFEPELYEKAGVAATYVGHPLAGSRSNRHATNVVSSAS